MSQNKDLSQRIERLEKEVFWSLPIFIGFMLVVLILGSFYFSYRGDKDIMTQLGIWHEVCTNETIDTKYVVCDRYVCDSSSCYNLVGINCHNTTKINQTCTWQKGEGK